MSVAIVEEGLVSPFGTSPREHVCFLRELLPSPAASPFLLEDDRRFRAFHCPWVPGREGAARMLGLALQAAAAPLERAATLGLSPVRVALVLPSPRPGFSAEQADHLERELARRWEAREVTRLSGAAGTFDALGEACAGTKQGAWLLCAVDSFIDLDWVEHCVSHPRTRWSSVPPSPSEAAAAVLLVDPQHAASLGIRSATIVEVAAAAPATASEDNDAPVDAVAMTQLLRGIATFDVELAFGQDTVDALRMQTWHRAIARMSERFFHVQNRCVEDAVGTIGAAAGCFNLVYGSALMRFGLVEAATSPSPALAWAVSSNGTVGAARFKVRA